MDFDYADSLAGAAGTVTLNGSVNHRFVAHFRLVRLVAAAGATAGNRRIQLWLTHGSSAANGLLLADTGVVVANTTTVATGGPTPAGEGAPGTTHQAWPSEVVQQGTMKLVLIATGFVAGDTMSYDISGDETLQDSGGPF